MQALAQSQSSLPPQTRAREGAYKRQQSENILCSLILVVVVPLLVALLVLFSWIFLRQPGCKKNK